MLSKTITAIATPPGESAIAVIRLSGDDSIKICQPLCSIDLNSIEPKKMILLSLRQPDNHQLIDQVMLTKMLPPASFTGELMIEIYSHGGLLIPETIQSCLIKLGASPAEPGEFSQRAVINGKMDLLTAESINQMIQAKTIKELHLSHANFTGELNKSIKKLTTSISSLITTIDATLCFPEDIEEEELNIVPQIKNISCQIKLLIKNGNFSKDLQKGFRVLISGKTNVGKSSLFNILLGWERMKVTPFPSTTHDYVSERMDLEGYPVYLIDSAGWIENPNHLDRIFNETITDLINTSFVVLFVVDLTDIQEFDVTLLNTYSNKNLILVFNKLDLTNGFTDDLLKRFQPDIPKCIISTYSKEGIDTLITMIADKLKKDEPNDIAYLINERQYNLIVSLDRIFSTLSRFTNAEKQLDIVRFELKEAIHILEEMVGENITTDIYNQIFSRFCIGK